MDLFLKSRLFPVSKTKGNDLVLLQQERPSGRTRSKDFDACRFDFRIDSKNGLTPSRRKKTERRNTHYNTLFKCKVCGNLFDSRPALLEHKMIHNDHKCPHCDAHFTRKTALKDHVLVHVWSKYPKIQPNTMTKRGRQRLVSRMLETPNDVPSEEDAVQMAVSQMPLSQPLPTGQAMTDQSESPVSQQLAAGSPQALAQAAMTQPPVIPETVGQLSPVATPQPQARSQLSEAQMPAAVPQPGMSHPVLVQPKVPQPSLPTMVQPIMLSPPVLSSSSKMDKLQAVQSPVQPSAPQGDQSTTSSPISMAASLTTTMASTIPASSGTATAANPMQSYICINVPLLLAPQGGQMPGPIMQPQFLQTNAMMQPGLVAGTTGGASGSMPQSVPILSPVMPSAPATAPQPQTTTTLPSITAEPPGAAKQPSSPGPPQLPLLGGNTSQAVMPTPVLPATETKEDLEPGEIRPLISTSSSASSTKSSTQSLMSSTMITLPGTAPTQMFFVPKDGCKPAVMPVTPPSVEESTPRRETPNRKADAPVMGLRPFNSKRALAKKIQEKQHALEQQQLQLRHLQRQEQRHIPSPPEQEASFAVDLTMNSTKVERPMSDGLTQDMRVIRASDDAIAMQREYNLLKKAASQRVDSPPPKRTPPPLLSWESLANEQAKPRKPRKGLNSMVARLWQSKMNKSQAPSEPVAPVPGHANVHNGHAQLNSAADMVPLRLDSPSSSVDSPSALTDQEGASSPASSAQEVSGLPSSALDAALDLSMKTSRSTDTISSQPNPPPHPSLQMLPAAESWSPKIEYFPESLYEPPAKKARDCGSFFKFHTCRVCKQLFESADAMWEHCHKVHQGLRKRQYVHCKKCAFVCTTKRDLCAHQRKEHRGEPTETGVAPDLVSQQAVAQREALGSLRSYVHTDVGPREDDLTSGQGFICGICGKCFSSKATLQLHLDGQHPDIPKQYLCEYSECAAQFSSQTDLAQHLNEVHSHHMILMSENKASCSPSTAGGIKPSVVMCDFPGCDRAFGDYHQLKLHRLVHSGERPLSCELCDYTCRHRSSLNWHMKNKHGLDKKRVYGNRTVYIDTDGKVVCSGGGEDCRSAETSDDSNHAPSSSGSGPVDMTKFADSEEETLSISQQEDSDVVILSNEPTTVSVNQPAMASVHETPNYTMSVMKLKHMGMPGYQPSTMESKFHTCQVCKQLFTSAEKMWEHRVQEHSEHTKFFCHTCGHESRSSQELQSHMTTSHGKEIGNFRDFTCFICGKGYACKTGLNQHLLRHGNDGTARYTCPYDDCNSKLQSKGALKNHMRRVHMKTSQSQYQCQQEGCERKFDNISALRAHQLVHLDERLLPCNYPGCDRAFRESKHLKVHRMQHTDEKPMKCFLCDYSCRQRNSMNWHMKSKHNMMKQVSPDGRTVYVPI